MTGSCTFTSAGVYSVKVTVRDDDGGSDSKTSTGKVVVYDPNGGWVTGGGWVNSPAGAYAASMTLTGKITFSFVARYESADAPPAGSVDVKMSLAKLDFRSTSFDWLVVGDGVARFQGRGTMNGSGDYCFSITARDGDTDEIRIRIWRKSTGAMAYDSQSGALAYSSSLTPLEGGSIQIHAP